MKLRRMERLRWATHGAVLRVAIHVTTQGRFEHLTILSAQKLWQLFDNVIMR
jgi:hypothetical protein